jgi:hypothetical protein
MGSQMSRRAVMTGGAALGAAAAAGAITGGQRAGALALQPPVPIPPGARVGATFDLFAFAPGTTYSQAVTAWNRRTGTTMRCWKIYYVEGQLPTPSDPRFPVMREHGIQALISLKPSRHLSATERGELEAAVRSLQRHKVQAEICLWQEVGPGAMSADQYHSYVKYYGPAIRAYYPLVFDAGGSRGPAEWKAYDPGHAGLDGYAVDFYCDIYARGVRLDPLLALAGDLPVGVWEIGNTITNTPPKAAQVGPYMDHIRTTLSKRAASGLPVGSVAWYDGPANPHDSVWNEIVGAHPCSLAPVDIRYYRELYQAVNGAS